MKSFCHYYNLNICSSCDLISEEYDQQLVLKEQNLLKSFNNLLIPTLLKSVRSPTQHFRNKAKLVVTGSLTDPVLGLWGTEDLDEGRELLACPLHVEKINQLLPALKSFIKIAQLTPYQIKEKKGELKGVIIFYSEESGEGYLRLVLRSKEAIDRIKKHVHSFLAENSFLRCLSVNIQPVPHAILEGEEEIFISEKKTVTQKLSDVSFMIDPRAFVQTNQKVARALYETAALWVKESGQSKFLELFCGQGAFSFFIAPHIHQGLGIEINKQAIESALLSCHKLRLKHLAFKAADAGSVKEEVANFGPDLILVNPPRRGLGTVADLLLLQKPRVLIYSSCNHQTLASDLKKLSLFYDVEKIQLFDMFPHTSHFEVLVKLKLKEDD